MSHDSLPSGKLKKKVRELALGALDAVGRCVGLVMFCRKCGKQKQTGRLVRWLEKRLEARGLGDRVQVAQSGCHGTCPRKLISVALGTDRGKDWSRGYLVDPEADRERLFDTLVERLAV